MSDMSWLSNQYSARKQAAEAQVTQWVPYSGTAYSVDPLHFLVNRFAVGERLTSDEGATCWYGQDDTGRIWVERCAASIGGQHYETFFTHGGLGTEELALYTDSPDKSAIRFESFAYNNEGRLAVSQCRATGGSGLSRFHYTAGRLTRVDEEYSNGEPIQIQVTYDGNDEISLVMRGPEVAYRALPPGRTLEDIERAFVDRLVEAIPAAVAADPPPVTPACVVLSYSPGQFNILPPVLMFPMEEGDEGVAALLADAEYHEIVVAREDAAELYELADYLDRTRLSDDRLRALLIQVCRRLEPTDWAFAVADGFLVFASDLEQVDLADNLQAVTTAARTAHVLTLAGLA
ncbi:hypothetical protein ACFYO1_13225 [Nocardia sp. NPDC006044]|uniref:hypothetical protein n=1 Tax=Nocardia sp. NPDC006044 TaxID=3364306 RepID=UPI0036C73EA2